MKQGALVSTRYTTVSVLRTIESVLGLSPLGLNDGLALPMVDLFDPALSGWTYRATAADVLRTTQLPIPADRFSPGALGAVGCATRSAAWWAAAMKGQDFSVEDHLDTARFNAALWAGLGNGAEPTTRTGLDLHDKRPALLATTQRCPA